MRSELARTVLAILTIAGLVAPLPASGRGPTKGRVGKDKGAFHVDCSFSHRAPDDPIVFPRGPGAAHSHDFFGTRNTNAFTTNSTLRTAPTSCVRTDSRATKTDRSAYWVPTLFANGQLVVPAEPMGAYYKTGRRLMRSVRPFPRDLRVIAGSAKGGPQEAGAVRIYWFECAGGAAERGSPTVAPTCRTPRLDLTIAFPDCWNGTSVDSADHQSHMAYSVRRRNGYGCPGTHPIAVPRLEIKLRYPTYGGPSTRLASGGIETAHADFMNGWNQRVQRRLVARCLRADKYCGGSDRPVPGHQ